MEEIVAKHSAIMDQTDPKKKVGLIVDEWGTWYDVEPGTNPGFLYQQNTIRDALTAGITLNIFHQHAERVPMANIAQVVNVLQAMILTDKEKMLLTPTYHVFDMYQVHQGAASLPVEVASPEYKMGERSVPTVHASASRDKAGKIHLSLVNLHPQRAMEISAKLTGAAGAKSVTGQVLTGLELDSRNTFENPDKVKPEAFTGAKIEGDTLALNLPAKSVVVLEIQ
jgi:alpha-N-arabinofuranosidase